ncbi:phytanoyl-CoA dioxygenase family protein [Robbsia andropogonis]|uniref:phytanoyl-CoA dioxygenase family protein n=1 Tax=Robbsia andropogonis TaxID=28092 RepID=UPI000616FE85|nr:phytanoyl-CoA dioxygenase family protein [Robbsia andropogonis]
MNASPHHQPFADAVAALDRDGFVHLPGVISTVELDALRHATDAVITRSRTLSDHPPAGQHGSLPGNSANSNEASKFLREDVKYCAVVDNEYVDGNTLCRIEYMLDKGPEFKRLLGHPTLLNFAAHVLQSPFLLTWEDMIIKVPYCGIPVPAHQDLKYQSNQHRVFSAGIYLDDSFSSPFECIPGTHRLGPLDKPSLDKLCRERVDSFHPILAHAGDIVIHNVKVVHRSPSNASPYARRTLYFEFRSLAAVLSDSPWSVEWAYARLGYLAYAALIRNRCPALKLADDMAGVSYDRAVTPYWDFPFEKGSLWNDTPTTETMQRRWRINHDRIYRLRECDERFL